MTGVSYQRTPVFRAKLNKKSRLIYTYVLHEGTNTLLVLALLEDHKYDRLKRQLNGLDNYLKNYLALDEKELPSEKKSEQDEKKTMSSPMLLY
jgi:hypothetical protein